MGYLRVIYSEKRRPYTSYPSKLCRHIAESCFKPDDKTLLDVGCGRGEHLREFQKLGYEVKGVDLSEEVKELLKDIDVEVKDIEKESLPYGDNSFDVVFNKSLIEHLNNPENFIIILTQNSSFFIYIIILIDIINKMSTLIFSRCYPLVLIIILK